jgi:hypothetical protein
MIERYFSQPKVLIRLRSGSVGPYLPRFRERSGAEALTYDSLDCELELVRWYGVFERRSSDHSGGRQRIAFGAFDALEIAQQACETHAQFEA